MTLQQEPVIPDWTLGDRLRKARESANLSQQELADKIGISRRSVSSYEADGGAKPRRPVILAWSVASSVPATWLDEDFSMQCLVAPDLLRQRQVLVTAA